MVSSQKSTDVIFARLARKKGNEIITNIRVDIVSPLF